MAEDMALAAMFEYYERGGERGRLDEPAGQLEFARTRQIIADDQDRRVVIETAAALERVPELIGIGSHLLGTAHRPPG
jgi:hypothetical protein